MGGRAPVRLEAERGRRVPQTSRRPPHSTVSVMRAARRGRAVLSCTSAWRASGAVSRRGSALSGLRARQVHPGAQHRGHTARAMGGRLPRAPHHVRRRFSPRGLGGRTPLAIRGFWSCLCWPASTPAVWRCPAPAAPRCCACLRSRSALAPARLSARGRLLAQAAAQPGADGEPSCGLGRERQLPGALPNVRAPPAPPGTVSVRSPAARRAPTPCAGLCVCVSATPQTTLWYPASARA